MKAKRSVRGQVPTSTLRELVAAFAEAGARVPIDVQRQLDAHLARFARRPARAVDPALADDVKQHLWGIVGKKAAAHEWPGAYSSRQLGGYLKTAADNRVRNRLRADRREREYEDHRRYTGILPVDTGDAEVDDQEVAFDLHVFHTVVEQLKQRAAARLRPKARTNFEADVADLVDLALSGDSLDHDGSDRSLADRNARLKRHSRVRERLQVAARELPSRHRREEAEGVVRGLQRPRGPRAKAD